jgi:glycerol uptake facilitator-like aquaporin
MSEPGCTDGTLQQTVCYVPTKTAEYTLARKLTSEFIGTALLLMAVIGSAVMGTNLADGNDALVLLANAIATGTALAVLILIFGPISGAHFNPAVSLAFLLHGELSSKQFGLFVAAQVAGGVIGVIIAHLMFDLDAFQVSEKIRSGGGQWIGEAVATFALLATIFGLLKTTPHAIPYAVGLIITAGYWYTSSTSFANPAVTFARMLTETAPGIAPSSAPAFMIIQFAVAAATAALFGWLNNEEQQS